jgi:hypothetical protein
LVSIYPPLIKGYLRVESDHKKDSIYECAYAKKTNKTKTLDTKKPVRSNQIYKIISSSSIGDLLPKSKQKETEEIDVFKLLWKMKPLENKTTLGNYRKKSIQKGLGVKRVVIDVNTYYPSLMQVNQQRLNKFQVGKYSKILTEVDPYSVLNSDFKFQGNNQ